MIKIALCDDNEIERGILKNVVEGLLIDIGYSAQVFEFSSGEKLLRNYSRGDYDVIFLDVQMKQLDGIETGRAIREKDVQVEIIYATSSEAYMKEGYDIHALAYLLKPYRVEKVRETLEYYLKKYDVKKQDEKTEMLEVTIQQISKAVMPMIAASVAVLLLITYVPQISTFLPKALAKVGAYTGAVAAATNSDTSSGDGADGSTAGNSSGNEDYNDIADYSDLGWEEQTWNFTCSTTETSTWAEGGRKFGELMEKATGGKIKVNVYAADQLTNGNQSEGIQALMNGDPVQISMHSNLIYSAFDPRFNVVSLPFLFDSVEDADAKLDGEAGEKLKEILDEYGLHCMGIAENGFRQLTNSKQEVKTVDDMKNLKIRVAGSNLLMECYKRWGADATNMNWSETYTALQQKTVEGQENPLPAIDAASVQEVQPYCSMWNAIYDCLFFCINGDIYDSMTPEQQEVIDECGRLATQYEREINRACDDEIMNRWQNENGVTITNYEDMDIDSFKQAVDGVDEWYQKELEGQGYDDAKELIETFTK